ncbi:MAG: serine/threonine protein kinase, partial [Candidatus Krumholzibacteria bacterium]|nr:serine/threonine protein kinase [Candidatus Krumholzibacteria bacterium]
MNDFKNFKVIQTVASGGSAVLFKAVQTSLDRVVAIKRLHQHLTDDENFTRRFILEAKAAASLDHENIVHVIDFGHEADCYQIVMEYVEGESLSDILERWRPIKHDLALAIVRQICLGLEHAHAKGIVHRDIKPGNVLLTQFGRVKITDFGLAKLTQSNTSHTAANSILGTPLYMSPEQAFGESVDHRSDLFSLGTVLYELLTGKQPFASENYMGVIQNIINKEIPSIRDHNMEIPYEIEAIVDKALSRSRENRFQTAREFRETIDDYLGHERLSQATADLKVLLEKPTTTRVLSSSGIRKPRRRKSTANGVVALVVFALIAAGSAAVIYDPTLLDRFRQPGGSGTATGGPLQQQAATTSGSFDFDLSDLIEDDTVAAADSTPEASIQAPSVDTDATEATAPARSNENIARAFTPDQTPPKQVVEEKHTEPAKQRVKIGYFKIEARPSAEIYIDNVYKGDTPPAMSLELTAGDHKVECRHPRYETYTEVLRIINGELSRRNVTLRKLKGGISFATQEGAEVYIDGRLVGVTPIRKPLELDAGPHMVTLKKAGFFTWSSEVTVESNKTLPIRIT